MTIAMILQDPSNPAGYIGLIPLVPSAAGKMKSLVKTVPKGIPGKNLPGKGHGWTKLRGNQGWRDAEGNIWKKDMLHKDHYDIMDSKGNKISEVDFEGRELWPNGPKNKNK